MRRSKTLKAIAVSKRALESRIGANKNAERDYDEWCINLLPKLPLKVNILDLGCGTGKQINLFTNFFGEDSEITGVDKSKESLNVIEQNYKGQPKLCLINDDFANYLRANVNSNYFDLVYSFYAFYYADNLTPVVKRIHKVLKKKGTFWTVSPYLGTNREIFTIITKLYPLERLVTYSIEQFHKDIIFIAKEAGFKKMKIDIFKNKVIYTTEQQLINYLRNTTFYKEEFDKEILWEIQNCFKTSNPFNLTKNVISIKVEK